ncbi:MAG: ABC transporter permease, partial [Acidobacteria bacterium]|nr:ABC transporter permease [Acidobacteriota bacterium]
MITNYLKVSLRSLQKNYIFSIINIFGLAVGLASFLLILQYVQYETSYDRFHENADNIYRLRADMFESGKLTNSWATACAGIAPAIKEKFPEISDIARLVYREGILSYEENRFRENRVMFVEPSFMRIFTFPIIKGDAITALTEPNSILISESYAKKYFGNEDPMGKTIKVFVDGPFDCMIKGIFKDIPSNSHLDANVMISYQTLINSVEGEQANANLVGFHYYIYILFGPGARLHDFDEKINKVYYDMMIGFSDAVNSFKSTRVVLHLQPLTSIHLNSNYQFEIKQNGSSKNLYFMLLMALIILLVVSLNYILLAAAKALERFKETGIRMVLGATRTQLIKQFLAESLPPAGISVLITFFIIG